MHSFIQPHFHFGSISVANRQVTSHPNRRPSARVDAYFCEGFGMAQGEIVGQWPLMAGYLTQLKQKRMVCWFAVFRCFLSTDGIFILFPQPGLVYPMVDKVPGK
jgi:hypothetical protein